jgi:hypothetical protein
MDQGWSVKQLIRGLVLSRAYRMGSGHHPGNAARDPDNIALWRMNVRRLEVEAMRDAILAVSGQLELDVPEGSPVMNLRLAEIGRGATIAAWEKSNGRSVYLPVLRNRLPSMFEVFDFAEPSSVMGRRDVTTVSTQALFMMNSRFVMEQSRLAAGQWIRRHPAQPAARLQLAYELALGRPPADPEVRRALAFVEATRGATTDRERQAWAGLCQALFASAEFRYVQ